MLMIHIGGEVDLQNENNSMNLNEILVEVLNRFRNQPASELANRFKVNLNAKGGFSTLIFALLKSISSEEIDKIVDNDHLIVKTIRLDKYGQLKESVSLPVFQYEDIVLEKWETSKLRKYFTNNHFIFVAFKSDGKNQYLHNIKMWSMPKHILEEDVKCVWTKLQNSLINGNIVKYVDNNGRYFSHFPSSSESPYVHVRPHAQNREDTLPLPYKDKLTGLEKYPKHSFWINRSFVLKILDKERDYV